MVARDVSGDALLESAARLLLAAAAAKMAPNVVALVDR